MVWSCCGEWLVAATNDLGQRGQLSDYPAADDAPQVAAPGWLDLVRYGARVLVRFAARQVARATSHDIWHVGVVKQSRRDLAATGRLGDVTWMAPAPRGRYFADPFVMDDGETSVLLVEDFGYGDGRARISQVDLADLTDAAGMSVAIDGLHHLSYPFVVEDGGEVFCVPEQGESGCLTAYRRVAGAWQAAGTIGAGPVIDGTLIRRDGKWWLFGGLPDDAQYALRLWYADDLAGPWQGHPQNPVKVDVRSARGAGPLFSSDGRLFRPAQNSATGYGGSVALMEVTTLTPTAFSEELRHEIVPDPTWPFPDGLHTISWFDGGFAIDAKKTRLSPRSGFYRLLTKWRRVRRLATAGWRRPLATAG